MASCNLQNFGPYVSQFREIQLFREIWRISLIPISWKYIKNSQKKVHLLARITPYMSIPKRKLLMNLKENYTLIIFFFILS